MRLIIFPLPKPTKPVCLTLDKADKGEHLTEINLEDLKNALLQIKKLR